MVIAEPADNAGGGSASDNTLWLQALIKKKVRNAAIAPIWDPQVVHFAHNMGVGAKFRVRIGGKTSELSNKPVDADVEVIGLAKDGRQSFGDAKTYMGDMAALRIGDDLDVVCLSHRTQAFGLELFELVNVNPRKKALIVVKSAQHFHGNFGPIAARCSTARRRALDAELQEPRLSPREAAALPDGEGRGRGRAGEAVGFVALKWGSVQA